MAVTEQQRHRLLTWFEEQMGQDLGATMMELLPPNDASQLATKADLAVTTADLRSEIGLLKSDLAEFRAEWKSDLVEFQRTFATWLIASQAAVITAIGVATGLILGLS